ncbi:MAG: fused MFS/spermidine synthase [Deltaproteobacteria bacterium]|nr:fused MFS/spermidine synthase [Deltaproteobacteria bacterium]
MKKTGERVGSLSVVYGLFFLSGASALVYEVAWVRSLSLVFGGSHLAVTTVLAVFMGGLALGSRLLGRRADEVERPLRLFGLLELGTGVFALVFLGLMKVYPEVYGALARLGEDSRVYLSVVRVLFAVAAMIVPTTLMGGTLPVLSRFVSVRSRTLGRQLSFLYGFNTLGAVAGVLAAGFFLLETLGVTATIAAAAGTSLLVGLVASTLPEERVAPRGAGPSVPVSRAAAPPEGPPAAVFSARWVLWGIGVSGFCALGYEVLWTRMLSLVVGTSVYSFNVILVAFLSGIALGSQAHGLVHRRWKAATAFLSSADGFAAVQVAIGLTALAVTILMQDLPSQATELQRLLVGAHAGEFGARQGASFLVAFAYLFVPAFFMGVAFPLAGTVYAASRNAVGSAVGEILTFNTVGAILGASVSGFVLLYAFGIERSLQMLVVLNLATGLSAAASRWGRKMPLWAIGAGAAALLLGLAVDSGWGRFWDLKYFAIFRNNQRAAFDTPEKVRDALQNTDVLYYFEGANETISVIRPKGAMQAFVVNGRPEATTAPMDVQCQRTLGHLPMLLHPNPRKVFVLGTGTGMTLGATSIHPEVESLVLAEIEPGVIGAARTFAAYNHDVLDNPKLRIVFNDGRNYLATTRETFDVVTADPIHPWSGGAAYLYTTEYFRSVAEHLRPGGVACQWLPIYALSVEDVKTVVRTFAANFDHVMIWLTHYDAELVGSNSPLVIDEAKLARRMARPAIAKDLAEVEMGTAEDFLSYFVAGTEGARAFGRGGVLNTDDNLFLEFSAPKSMGVASVMGENVRALAGSRESLVPYLASEPDEGARSPQRARWERNLAAGRIYDAAHSLFLGGGAQTAPFQVSWDRLSRDYGTYAPFRFLEDEVRADLDSTPTLVASESFAVAADGGEPGSLQVSAVLVRIGRTRAAVMFVDNDRRQIYGQRYFDGRFEELETGARGYATGVLASLREAYGAAVEEARRSGRRLPSEPSLAPRLKERVGVLVSRGAADSGFSSTTGTGSPAPGGRPSTLK